MKPTQKIDAARTPDGGVMELLLHDGNYRITVDRQLLMTSKSHESELELARLGCSRLTVNRNAVVLIGGLGMGYTLRAALDLLPPEAQVVVAELMPEVVKWNEQYFGELNGHPLKDPRVTLETQDVMASLRRSPRPYDAILLDVDNGPNALTTARNNQLYCRNGIRTLVEALVNRGCLAIWSASVDSGFSRAIQAEGFHVRWYRVPSHKSAKSLNRCIWMISRDIRSLPPVPEKIEPV